jgi:hypothetical protein
VRRTIAAGLVAGWLLVGCSWFAANAPTVEQDAEQAGACVLGQVLTGDVVPLTIVAACVPVTLADVTAILMSIVNFYDSPQVPDGGAPSSAAAMVTWHSTRLNADLQLRIPAAVSADLLGRLHVARDNAAMAAHAAR